LRRHPQQHREMRREPADHPRKPKWLIP
jgi:hypothetical protein